MLLSQVKQATKHILKAAGIEEEAMTADTLLSLNDYDSFAFPYFVKFQYVNVIKYWKAY
jgi:hypothetical protein